MATEPNARTGTLTYPKTGFAVTSGPEGLVIRVIDYHAKELHLSWDLILDLAGRRQEGEGPGH